MARAAADSGFTLVELLTALVLMMFIGSLMFSGFDFGARVWEKVGQQTSAEEEVATARLFLTQHLKRIYPEFIDDSDDQVRITFVGTSKEMFYTAPLPDRLGIGGNHRFALYFDEVEGEHAITLAWVFDDNINDPRHLKQHQVETLAVLNGHGSFAYTGAEGETSGQWEEKNTLPVQIHVHFGSLNDGNMIWPDLVVSPMIDVDAECVFDPVTRDCRGRPK